MLHTKSYLKRTKKGNAVKVVKEHYLRDDIGCAVEGCTICSSDTAPVLKSTSTLITQLVPKPHFIIPDTNVFMRQIDIIGHEAIKNVIILQTVYEELRNLNSSIFNRLKELIKIPERCFFVFSNEHHRETYIERLKDEKSNDRNDRVREYVESMTEYPELVDMIGNISISDNKDKKFVYDDYIGQNQITNGIKNGTLHQGELNISTHNYLEGSIMSKIDGEEAQIMIIGRRCLNRAIQGDVVVVQLLPKSEWLKSPTAVVVEEDEENNVIADLNENGEPKPQTDDLDNETSKSLQPTGKVVGIIKRNWRTYCGSISNQSVKGSVTSYSSEIAYVYTMDRRIPRIIIRTRQAQKLIGQRIVVSIDSWSKDTKFPTGHFVKALGPAGDKETETNVLLLEHEIRYQDFSQQILKELPVEGENWIVKDEHFKGRKDFRKLNVCSIDPPGCTDIDDALHVRELPNGNYEVGVHVTYFVKPGTAMDEEASVRGTTVYLINKRIDMLPPLLGTNLCSLHEKKDRLAFSCVWELNHEAEIVKVDFTKSVIQSKASLTYEEAQLRIDDFRLQDELTKGLRILNELAKKLHKKRIEGGAITLSSPEVRFQLDFDSQDPTNALVEEFMLLANISVAKKIFSKFSASSLLRRHPPLTTSKMANLVKAITPLGLTLKFDTSKELADSLDAAIIPDDPYFNKLLRIMTTRCMMQAMYFCSGTVSQQDFKHYGLAIDIYTHFTSPIRRYSDVIVHRMLAAAIDDSEIYGNELTDIEKIRILCEGLNYRHRMAQSASRSSVELHTHIFFKGKKESENGYVTKILKNGFIVLIPNLETYSSDGKIIGTIKLFDKVVVAISVEGSDGDGASGMRQKLKMELIYPVVPGLSISLDNNDDGIDNNREYSRKKDLTDVEEGNLGKRLKI
ncbi:9467_t:CDS:10 [Entrophospora sp. SA101]|nr:2285_t:CDS:10 [Entrophospora sp. SA101]CAJ0646122.1 9467_t:CDS:10 [Entrophospora sp. SA101]CAJ0885722.1 15172_t:CDS:10 [Entrophospora sp. SA101]CAJ0904648.1 20464_t:CDS:10 [Entrophospora sp. SA101]